METRHLAEQLSRHTFRMGSEAVLQDDVELFLLTERAAFLREHRFGPAERVDFFVDGHIALELKIRAQRKLIFRQLERYAKHDAVDSLILMTAAAMGMPREIGGKPVYVIQLGRSAL